MNVVIGLALIVVQCRHTFHAVPPAELICKILKHLLRLVLRVNFGQGDNQLPCLNTFPLCAAALELLPALPCEIIPKGIVGGAVSGVQIFLSCVAGDIRYSSFDINELLKASIQSEGVINLFESAKMGEKFSLFDPSVLEEIARMKEKNIVVEILRKLMAEQIAIYKRTNVVQATTFSDKITLLMNTYYNGLITNEEVIKELLKTAEEINALRKEGEKLGLSEEELAFYDALTKPEHIKDFYENETLIALTRELTEMLRKNRTIDWQKKETARAGMRKMVKRLLKKYKYPPEKYEDAIETVMSQCELWTDQAEM